MKHNKIVVDKLSYQAVRETNPGRCDGCSFDADTCTAKCSNHQRDDYCGVIFKRHYSGPELARLIRNESQKKANLAPYLTIRDELWEPVKPCNVPDPLPTMKGFVGLGPLPKVSRIFHGTVDPMAQCYMPILLS